MALNFRRPTEADHARIVTVVDAWWGRPVAALLPHLFFEHFGPTSCIVEDETGQLAGFLVGFLSPSRPGEAYIHFVGVAPEQRGSGLGRELYERFFQLARDHGCHEVHSITSPINRASIAFHLAMGFEVMPGSADFEGVAYTPDLDGPGDDRVRFRRAL